VSDPRPIGVFDSGVGGLTVLREILRRTPSESTVYLGDNARAPYGTRTDDEVRAFSIEALDVLASRDVKAIVVACNTSTAVALGDLRRRYDLPILGVIRPGAVAATLTTRERRVGVIATPATVRSHAYFAAIKDENPAVEVYEHATPALVPMVEAGRLSGPDVEVIVRRRSPSSWASTDSRRLARAAARRPTLAARGTIGHRSTWRRQPTCS
jgi:glutamate racemase